MANVIAQTVVEPGEVPPSPLWISRTFGHLIDGWRHRHTEGLVLLVKLDKPSASDWVELGEHLLRLLLEGAPRVTALAEGEWPADPIIRWSRSVMTAGEEGTLDLTFN